jgi:hypothetical protein
MRGFRHSFRKAAATTLLTLGAACTTTAQDSSFDTTGVARLRNDFSQTSLGSQGLQILDEAAIDIFFNASTAEIFGQGAVYMPEEQLILIDSESSRDAQLSGLARETKKVYNGVHLSFNDLAAGLADPSLKWAAEGLSETDACAFEALYAAQREITIERQLRNAGMAEESGAEDFSGGGAENSAIVQNLKAEILKDGLSEEEYRYLAIEPLLPLVNRKMATVEKISAAGAVADSLGAWLNRADISALPDPGAWREAAAKTPIMIEALEENLRGLGGMALSSFAGTAFEDNRLSRDKMLKDYPFRGLSPEVAASVKRTLEMRDESSRGWHKILQPLLER